MAKKKGNSGRARQKRQQRRQQRQARKRAQKPGTTAPPMQAVHAESLPRTPAAPLEPSRAARAPRPQALPTEYRVSAEVADGACFLGPGNRLYRASQGRLALLSASECRALPVNMLLEGSFDVDLAGPTGQAAYVLAAPALRGGVAQMQVAILGVADPEVDGLLWHPTYTARVAWEGGSVEAGGEWRYTIHFDRYPPPSDAYAECFLGPDGDDDDWQGGFDFASDLANELAADHIPELLALARSAR